jgi:hypothetical protein
VSVRTSGSPNTRAPRSRLPLRLLLILIGLVVLAVVVDRAGCWIAQDRAAAKFQASQHLAAKPKVKIAGFPFLTQVAHRSFDQVSITARNLLVDSNGRQVRISTLQVELYGVQVSKDLSSATARSGTGRAVIGYPALSQSAGVPVDWAGNGSDSRGRVKATKTIKILGQSFSGSVSAEVVVAGRNTVEFAKPKVTVSGLGVPQIVTDQFAALLPPLVLDRLPSGLTVRNVSADSDGLIVDLTAKNVTVH